MYCQQSRSNRCGWIQRLGLFQRRTPHVGLRADASRREDETDRCPSSMDRRKRGKRKSSNCFQRCLTFSFLRFIANPEMELGTALMADSSGKKIQTQHREHRDRSTEGTEKCQLLFCSAGILPAFSTEEEESGSKAAALHKRKRPDGGRGTVFYRGWLTRTVPGLPRGKCKKKSRSSLALGSSTRRVQTSYSNWLGEPAPRHTACW